MISSSYLKNNKNFNKSLRDIHILLEAKNEVLSMADDYTVPEMESFKLPGKSGRLVLEGTLKGFVKAGKIS